MASLYNTKISATYPGLIKTLDTTAITATLKQLSDGNGNATGLFVNTAGDFKVTAILEWGSLKDTGTGITISKFVSESDGIANNDNDTTIPTSAAVIDYVQGQVTLVDLDFLGDSNTGTPAVDLDSQSFSILGTTNQVITSGADQTLTLSLPPTVHRNLEGNVTGDLTGNVTATSVLADGVSGTTQTVSDDSTKVATTAFVQDALSTVPAGLVFQGTWNADTNTPTLASGTGTTGHFYIVSVAGSTDLDGITDWQVGDWAVFVEQGATDQWEKVDNSSVLDGTGTGGKISKWAGSGDSVTLTNSVITESGSNIGIGVSNPTEKLEVDGAILWSGALGASQTSAGVLDRSGDNLRIRAYGATVGSGALQFRTGGGADAGDSLAVTIDSSQAIQFNSYGTGTLVSDASGNITSISGGGEGGPYLPLAGGTLTGALTGTSATFAGNVIINNSAEAILKVETTGSTSSSRLFLKSPTREWRIGVNDSFNTGSLFVYNTEANTYPFIISSAGNVGIGGTTQSINWSDSPTVTIEGSSPLINLVDTTAGYDDYNILNDNGNFRIFNDTDGRFDFNIDGAGNVGIGTSTPNETLSLYKSDRPYIQFTSNTTGTTSSDGSFIGFANADGFLEIRNKEAQPIRLSTSDTERMRIDSAGTTSIVKTSAGNSTTPLVVRNSGSTSVGTESKIFLSTVANDDRGAYISSIITDASNGNALILATNTAGASPTERMRIDSAGNLGLGTSTPTNSVNYNTLDIRGSSGGQIIAGRTSAVDYFMYTTSTSANIGGLNDVAFKAGTAGDMTTPNLYLKSGGNVGIGLTTPNAPLHIQKDSSASDVMVNLKNLKYGSTNTSGETKILFGWLNHEAANIAAYKDGTVNRTGFKFVGEVGYNTPVELMRITSAGKLGIGTGATVDANLHVVGTDIKLQGVGIAGDLTFAYNAGNNSTTVADVNYANINATVTSGSTGSESGKLSFQTRNAGTVADRMVIDSAGKVGIGVSAPVSTLHVVGSSGAIAGTGMTYLNNTDDAFSLVINNVGTSSQNDRGVFDARVGGSSVFKINNSGNVGIGVSAPEQMLEVNSSAHPTIVVSSATDDCSIAFKKGSGATPTWRLGRDLSAADNLTFAYNATGYPSLTGNSLVSIDTSGNVGIGTASPDFKTHLYDSGNTVLGITAGVANYASLQFGSTSDTTRGAIEYYTGDDSLRLKTGNNTERMRITSAGEFGFGTSSDNVINGSIYIKAINATNTVVKVGHKTGSVSGSDFTAFYYNNVQIGGVAQNGTTAVSFNTSSDYRLKENVVGMTGALDRVAQLKPSRFNFKTDTDKVVDGFLAHEVQSVVPEAITGTKDAMKDEEYEVTPAVYEDKVHPAIEEVKDEEGNVTTEAKESWTENVLVSEAVMGTRSVEDYQGIDQSKLVPLLVGAIQELRAEIELLKSK